MENSCCSEEKYINLEPNLLLMFNLFRWPHVERCLGKGFNVSGSLPLGRPKRVKNGTSGDKVTSFVPASASISHNRVLVWMHQTLTVYEHW